MKSINLSSFDTFYVDDMFYMLYGCISLKKIDLPNFLYDLLYSLKIIQLFGNIFNQIVNFLLFAKKIILLLIEKPIISAI